MGDASQTDSGSEVFQRLVKTLSNEEKRDLLRRLSTNPATEGGSLAPPVAERTQEWEEVYRNYGWFRKFLLWLRRFFRGTELAVLVHEQILEDLGFQLERQLPGFFNLRIRMAHEPFYRELDRLFASFDPFRIPFRSAYGNQKNEFIAFWTGLEFPELQDAILELLDFAKIERDHPERPVKEIKAIVDGDFRSLLDGIQDDRRKHMGNGFRALSSFRSLCLFPSEKLLAPFLAVSYTEQPGNALLDELEDGLAELAQRLWAMSLPVPDTSLEALFLFHYSDRYSSPEVDLETPVADFLDKAREAWLAIREFHRMVPLVKLCAWLRKDSSWSPSLPLGPTEDWLGQYRRFWQSRLDVEFDVFVHERKIRTTMNDIYQFLEMSPEGFRKENYYPPYYPGQLPTRGELSLIFLQHFTERIFVPKMSPLLKIVLLEGDFYKRNNRGAFTDCYNAILQIPDQLQDFRRRFSSEGEWGKRLQEIRKEEAEEEAVSRTREIFLSAASWVETYLASTISVLLTFQDVLRGLVKGETGGKYDTLANINSIGGKANGVFRRELDVLLKRWEKFLQILQELEEID